MNCYNGQEYLKECVDSVLSQTFGDWEIIFWDNQSTDISARIIKAYDDYRIRYFYSNRHTSLGEARNLAVDKARGKWLAFLDCDDIWVPQKLEKQINLVPENDNETGLVYGGTSVIYNKTEKESNWSKKMRRTISGNAKKILPEGDIFHRLLKLNFIPMVSCMVKKSLYKDVGGIDPKLHQGEDYDLFLKISKKSKAKAVQENICYYRVHGKNITEKQLDKNYKEAIQIASQYLPNKAARRGLRFHETYYAIYEISNGKFIKGATRLLFKGNIFVFIGKIIQFFTGKIIN